MKLPVRQGFRLVRLSFIGGAREPRFNAERCLKLQVKLLPELLHALVHALSILALPCLQHLVVHGLDDDLGLAVLDRFLLLVLLLLLQLVEVGVLAVIFRRFAAVEDLDCAARVVLRRSDIS